MQFNNFFNSICNFFYQFNLNFTKILNITTIEQQWKNEKFFNISNYMYNIAPKKVTFNPAITNFFKIGNVFLN